MTLLELIKHCNKTLCKNCNYWCECDQVFVEYGCFPCGLDTSIIRHIEPTTSSIIYQNFMRGVDTNVN